MWRMCCKIQVGNYTFERIHACKIKRSVHNLGATATITMPMKVYVFGTRQDFMDFVRRSDVVKIELGYDGNLVTEFEGFVTKVKDVNELLVIECEDNIFKLRKPLKNKSWTATDLKQVIGYVTADAGISVETSLMPSIKMDQGFILKNVDSVQAIKKLVEWYPIQAFFQRDGSLCVALRNTYKQGETKYAFGQNIVHSELDYKNADDVRIKVDAISLLKNNKRIKVTVGDSDGDLRTVHHIGISDKDQLTALAKKDIEKYKYTGFRGTFTTFLLPFASIGQTARISDPFHNRSGGYMIESEEVDFSPSGGRRTLEIGIKTG